MNDAVSGAPFTPPLSYDVATDHEATSSNGATPNIEDPRERDEGIRPHVIQESTSEEFRSILFDGSARAAEGEERTEPGYFPDLNLDQVFTSIATGYEEYDLAPFFYEHLDDANTISYRQEVFRDLERKVVFEPIASFVQQMRDMRAHLKQSNPLRYQYQKESWFVDATQIYYDAVVSLARTLAPIELESEGVKRFREYLLNYVQSPAFTSLGADAEHVKKGLSEVRYLLRIKGPRVTVAKYDSEADYSAEVLATFERFKQGAAQDYRIGFHNPPEMGHVEANILGLVARLYPDFFLALDDFCVRHRDYLDPTIRTFDREAHFYLSYLAHMRQFKSVGLRFCYPKVARTRRRCSRTTPSTLRLAGRRLVPAGMRRMQRLPPEGPRADHPRLRPEPGRQVPPRSDARPTPPSRKHRLPSAGAKSPALPVRQAVHSVRAGRGPYEHEGEIGGRPREDSGRPQRGDGEQRRRPE